jgi:hypothetical protein
MWRAVVARRLITMRIPVVHFATHNMGSWWESQGLYGSNPPTEMCEDVTLSATVASHHCAVHVGISLANEVGQTAGVGGLLGRARHAAATERLWESHCKWIRLAYWWDSLAVAVKVPAPDARSTEIAVRFGVTLWPAAGVLGCRFVLGIMKASTFTDTQVIGRASDQHRVLWTYVRNTNIASRGNSETLTKLYSINWMLVVLGWRNPTRCNSMQIFIYC